MLQSVGLQRVRHDLTNNNKGNITWEVMFLMHNTVESEYLGSFSFTYKWDKFYLNHRAVVKMR